MASFLCGVRIKFTKEQQETLSRIIRLKNGLVLVNGPTGSGKSTTLYTILNEIKDDDINISTLEDPVEILYKRMVLKNQMICYNLFAKKFLYLYKIFIRRLTSLIIYFCQEMKVGKLFFSFKSSMHI